MAMAKNEAKQVGEFEFVISRVFDAPRDLVWKAWTDPDRLIKWWGPKGFQILSTKVDLRVGGFFHYCLKSPEGIEMWGRFVYREIVAPELLVFVVSFSDEAGGVVRHPLSENWPLQIMSTVIFSEVGGKTNVTVKWVPYSANEIERENFEEGASSMQQGWTGTLDNLTDYLAALKP